MKYDIVEDDIKIGNKIIYGIDKDILDIIHSLEKENQELKADYGSKVQVERDMLQQENQQLKQDLKNMETSYLLQKEYNNELKIQISAREEVANELQDRINKLNTNWKEFEKYLDNNKLVLNNSNILQFYLIQKELLKGDKE